MVWIKGDKGNVRTGKVATPKEAPRSYTSFPLGSTASAVVGKPSTTKGSRKTTGIGAKNKDGIRLATKQK